MEQQQPDIALEKKIGSGAFGSVYSGYISSTKEKIAVKRISKKKISQVGDYLMKAFYKEIDAMKICACENSVRLIQTIETENNFNIVMELCDGDLQGYLNKSPTPFSVEEIRETFSQLNNVFKIMQKHKMVHRDLKLLNILIKYTDESKKKFIPKLSDYGFSKELDQDFTRTHLGTAQTMAPEVLMQVPYNEKSDLWSIGIMMYQLHYKTVPYSGLNENQVLRKIKNNYPRKIPNDPEFRDLLDKLFEIDPNKRISWGDYFNHPFFRKSEEKKESQYEKVSDIDLGYDYNENKKDLFYCYLAKDKKNEKNVIIKSYSEDLIDNNNQIFADELNLFKSFKENKRVLKLIETNKENNRYNLVFEYVETESIINYLKNSHEFDEKAIKKFNNILYYEIFQYSESNILPFSFISIHNFLIDKEGCPLLFDFGIHKLLIPEEEYSFYFLPDKTGMNNTIKNKIKTNVMNYGITLLKMFSGNNISVKGKEIILPEDIFLSEEFKEFLGKCLTRNVSKRCTWNELKGTKFLFDDENESNKITDKKPLIDDDKLTMIFEYLNNKFNIIINYYSNENFKDNPYLPQIDTLVTVTLFEMRIINSFFNRNIEIKPFTNQEEISFISIDSDGDMNKCDLNFVDPVLKDIELIKMNNNQLIKDFLINLQKNIGKMEMILINIQSYTKNPICSGDYHNFIAEIIKSISNQNKENMQQYFSKLISRFNQEKNEEIKYKESCIAQYLMEFILFIIIIINDNGKKINFNKATLLKKFYKIFGEEKNKIEISSISPSDNKSQYLIVSFLPILFKIKKSEFDSTIKLLKDRQSINGLIKYYPSLMRRINELLLNKS